MTASTPTTHPRFRERRITIRRTAGRRRLYRLLVLVGVAALALGALGIVYSPLLDVDSVTVTGTRHTAPAEIAAVAGIDPGTALLTADLEAAAANIEALPWISSATVKRRLPNGVDITVVERTPAAVIGGSGAAMLVDDAGRILAPAGAVVLSPPLVRVLSAIEPGVPGTVISDELRAAVQLAVDLRTNPEGAVMAIQVDPELSISLAAGGRALLGDGAQLAEKVEALRTAMQRIDLTCLDTLDLRVPTHPVLTRVASCS